MSIQTRVNMALIWHYLKLFRTKELCGVTADAKTHLVKTGLNRRGWLQDFKSNNLSNGGGVRFKKRSGKNLEKYKE
ncbi:12227_t:CDS:2, partial [Gigaspora rosea]